MTASIPRKGKKRQILERDGHRCWYCGRPLKRIKGHRPQRIDKLTLDHQEAKCRGGTSSINNLVAACFECNQAKGHLDVEAYRAKLEMDLPAGERVIFWGEKMRDDLITVLWGGAMKKTRQNTPY